MSSDKFYHFEGDEELLRKLLQKELYTNMERQQFG